ncbi:MAG: alpha/beta fold hydrolase [Syntrophomonadaceae bacterium]|nr:alpha/beta fold hydrolase [Syntrophomonadaceae bacterium]
MESKSLQIIKPDHQRIAALEFLPAGICRYIVVICHGFRGSKENGGKIFDFAERLNRMGLAVYAFDFLGSGESDGEFCEVTLSGQADDLARVIDHVCAIHQLPVILLGRSFGGSTVIKASSNDARVEGCILWSTPAQLQSSFATILGDAYSELEEGQELCFSDEGGIFWIGPALIKDFACHDMAAYIRSMGERPVLIIQGMADETVEPANGEFICSHCKNAELVLIEGADHRFSNRTREREEITIAWLEKNFTS